MPIPPLRSRWFASVRPLALLGLVALLAGCGVSTGPAARVAGSPTSTLAPIATPRPTSAPTPVGQQCATLMPPSDQLAATVGDIQFTAVHTLSIDPPRQLPDNLPSKPYQVSGGDSKGYLDSFPLVNVTYYSFSLCNASKTKTHVLAAMTVKLDAFQPDSNTINTSHYCIHLYTRQGMVDHTGCGGGFAGGDLNLDASFASNGTVGAVVPVSLDSNTGSASLPVMLAPGYGVYCFFNITPPSTPGSASYRLGIAIDTTAPVYPMPATAAVTNSTSLRQWDGGFCLSDAMQQQIPAATNPPTYYICPQP